MVIPGTAAKQLHAAMAKHPFLAKYIAAIDKVMARARFSIKHVETDAATSNEKMGAHHQTLVTAAMPSHWWCSLHQSQHVCDHAIKVATQGLGCNIASRLYSITLLLRTGTYFQKVVQEGTKCLKQNCRVALAIDPVTQSHHAEFKLWLLASWFRAQCKSSSAEPGKHRSTSAAEPSESAVTRQQEHIGQLFAFVMWCGR